MKLIWPTKTKRLNDQIKAETKADLLKEELEERRQKLLASALELSKGVNNDG